MRRGTIVAGLAVGVVIGTGSAAHAADLPITVTFGQGSIAVGTFPSAVAATPAAPATLTGTIDSTTFSSSFPATAVRFPDAVVENVDYGGTYGSGRFVVDAVPGAFTGTVNTVNRSLDLEGLVAYRLIATTAQGTYTCISDTPVPLRLTGTALDPTTGAYVVSGAQTSLTIRPEDPLDLTAQAFCSSQAQKVSPGAPVELAFSGSLAIPNVIPLPAGATSAPTPITPTPTTTTVKPGKLAVSVSRPKTVERGKSTVIRVTVRNTGAGPAKSVTVKLAASGKGVTPRSTTKSYASIAAGKSGTFSVRLRTKRTSARSSAVKVTVRGASGLSVSRSTTLRLR